MTDLSRPDVLPLPEHLLPCSPFTARDAEQVGVSKRVLDRLVGEHVVRRPVHGVYLLADVAETQELRAACLALVTSPGSVVTDQSAAWLWGVDTYRLTDLAATPRVDLFVLRGGKRITRPQARGGERDLSEGDWVLVEGLKVTTPLRTALDLACRLPRFEALAALDAMMRAHGLTREQLFVELRRYRRRRGVVQARELVALANPRSESSGESFTRIVIRDAGLPTPEAQVWVYDGETALFRLDLAYEEPKVAVEYDGEAHHTSAADRKRDADRRAWLRARGWIVIVLTKADLRGERLDAWLRELRVALKTRNGR